MPNAKTPYQMEAQEAIEAMNSGEKGLSSAEAAKRLQKYGNNQLQAKIRVPLWLVFLSQFKELLIFILILGGLISFFIGNYRDGSIIFIIVLVNAVIGFLHERKAGKIIDKLKTLIKSPAKVMRDGKLMEISQENLVPGDIVQIEAGDKLPADLRLININGLKTNDFALTGESVPQEKKLDAIEGEVALGDRVNMAYAGTTVANGSATGVVVATGMRTETGKIAGMTEEAGESETPLQKELGRLANQLTVTVVVISVGLFVLGLAQEFSLYMSLVYALGVAMAMVPQALPAQVTVALTTGSNMLADRNAVVKDLPSVETLGSTTVICTDKTGTLTKNEMTVQSLWFDGKKYSVTGTGYEPKGEVLNEAGDPLVQEHIDRIEVIMDAATMSSNAETHEPDQEHAFWYPVGDPTEAALITLSTKLGTRSSKEDEENPELQEFSFNSELMRMSSVRRFGDELRLAAKGSTASILSISTHIYKDGEEVPFSDQQKQEINALNEEYSRNGMRVLAIGCRRLASQEEEFAREDVERDLVFLGLMAMIDPPKEGVKEAIADAQAAHIRIYILTGDHPDTAMAVGREIGLHEPGEGSPVIIGTELKQMDDDSLKKLFKEKQSAIFARVDPEDKLRIVKVLEEQGEIVAVTGDGVNDAPALKRAHIGVAMGQRGNDVAKEAARLVLLDDNFSTLFHAIQEGRTIYSNLKKTIFASLTTNVGELIVVLLGLLAAALWGYPIPILAGQILAVDLLAEIGPLTFLTFDPPDKDVMTKRPRKPGEYMLNLWGAVEISFLGILIGGLAFLNFFLFMQREGITLTMDSVNSMIYFKATTLSYATIVFCQFFNILQRRSERGSLFSRNFFTNKILLYSILVSIGLVSLAVYGPYLSDFLSFGPIQFVDWMYVMGAAVFYLLVYEALKLFKRSRRA
ncbi:MAG: HAD-IC family P-type ATPase [Proteobacteria bacterium]|nr:HAD-IC family P-type ATPase [Pseudomonadota bacterium]MBU2469521.1 HAD-IC family P-type ATPase [Pseudomonadota bacterium]MBU2517338.1 HAD-IC family P-type ATPase [Pseudomonadota bacterium]